MGKKVMIKKEKMLTDIKFSWKIIIVIDYVDIQQKKFNQAIYSYVNDEKI